MTYLIGQILVSLVGAALLGGLFSALAFWLLFDKRRRELELRFHRETRELTEERDLAKRDAEAQATRAAKAQNALEKAEEFFREQTAALQAERDALEEDLTRRSQEYEAARARHEKERDDLTGELESERAGRAEDVASRDKRIAELNQSLGFERDRARTSEEKLNARVQELKRVVDAAATERETGAGASEETLQRLEDELRRAQMQRINEERAAKARIAELEAGRVQDAKDHEEAFASAKTRIQELNLKLVEERKGFDTKRMERLQEQLAATRRDLDEKESTFAERLRGVEGLLAKEHRVRRALEAQIRGAGLEPDPGE